MNRISALVSCALMMVTLLFIGHETSTQAKASASNVCGIITSDITWTAISSPYNVCVFGVTVGPTATLTIQPGVTVQFEGGAGNKLDVMGVLSAIGTVTHPIMFTGVITTPGSWAGLAADNIVSAPALVSLSYVTLDYGGVNGSYGAQVYADRAVITITHSLIRNGGGNGLYTTGFSAEEIADARALGLSNPDIEAIRQSIITAAPQDLAGDVIVKMQQVRDQFYLLGSVLTNPTAFAPGFSVGGGAGLQSLATGSNTMAQIYNTAATVQLGNPFSQTAMLAVRARRIDLPPNWAVDVSPAKISLAPGEQTTVTVRVLTGSPIQQGRVPRLAVEGYAGNQLLGGIAIDIVVPNYVFFDGKLHVYLPLVEK